MESPKVFRQCLNLRRVLWVSLMVCTLMPSGHAQLGKKADLSNLVVIGDSTSAGVQNGSLLETQQENGYASLLARQAEVQLPLPLIAFPGIPNVITNVSVGPPLVIETAPGTSTGRINPAVQTRNLAVPGATVQDALSARPSCDLDDPDLTDLVLGLPQPCLGSGLPLSQIERAEALNPTTVFVWLGGEDATRAALNGDSSLLTPPAAFETAFGEVMSRLAATGAKLVVANIPDVTAIPFFTPAPVAAGLFGVPVQLFLLKLGLGPGDLLSPDAFEHIPPIC
jgi:phospholipase/lecithinase/hemolysin